MQDIKALKAENIFVVLSLIMGLFYLVINPPFQAPDEAQHMFKCGDIHRELCALRCCKTIQEMFCR